MTTCHKIKLNCHVVGYDIGCNEAIITVSCFVNIFRDLNYSGANWICH